MKYEARFHRGEGWAECNGIRHEIKGRGRELVYPLCRLMVNAGLEDGPVRFFDERDMHCMSIKSFHAGAKLCLTEGDRFAVIKWAPFEERGNLGNTGPVVISEAWYKTLNAIMNGGKSVLDGLHMRTRNAFLTRGYVSEDGELTDKGLNAMTEYENTPQPEAEPEVQPEPVAEPPAPVSTPKGKGDVSLPNLLTEKQRDALAIAHEGSDVKWVVLHGKTSGFVLRKGWVRMEGARPVLTDEGLRVAQAFGVVKTEAA